jgi:hypothetical protein
MPYDHRLKEIAYKLDPECWVSYSGKPRSFKSHMDSRRTRSLRAAQDQFDESAPQDQFDESASNPAREITLDLIKRGLVADSSFSAVSRVIRDHLESER